MIVDRTITVAAPAEDVFRRVVDIPFVGSCLPGASDVHADGEDEYRGRFSVKVGPVKVNLEGSVRIVEIDQDAGQALLRLNGSDRRIGGTVVGDMDIRVLSTGAEESQLVVHTAVTIAGKLGQFGQAVMIKKADQITEIFVDEFSRRMVEDLVLEAKMIGTAAVDTPANPAPTVGEARARTADSPSSPPGSEPRRAKAPVPAGISLNAMPALHAVIALLRRGRRLKIIDSPASLTSASTSVGSGQLWITPAAPANGVIGEMLGGREYVTAVEAASAAQIKAKWDMVQQSGLGVPVAVAVWPTGAALADLDELRGVCAAIAQLSGTPVLVVASTPWSVLPLARLAATGVVQGIVLDSSAAYDIDTSSMMRLAVAEVRRAGLDAPIIAGPIDTAAQELSYRAAGADAVLVSGRRRNRRFGFISRA